LSADGKNTAYGAASGVEAVPADFLTYGEWLRQMTDAFGNDYPAISRAAHVFSTKLHPGTLRYWVMALGENADYWDECYEGGFAAMGWSDTGDLRGFTDKEGLRLKLVELHPGGTKKTNDALACWQFANDMHTGDVVFSKRGLSAVLGHGVVMGDYEFDTARPHFKHVRRVDWKTTGQWAMPDGIKLPMKTLTDVTPYPELVQTIIKTIGGAPPPPPPDPPPSAVSYWWLNANPTMWDLEATPVGEMQTYTSHNEKGNKRQKYRYFQEVKPGDVIIGYVTSPQKEVVALCRITKGLHGTTEGESIEFEKTERLGNPIPYSTLQGHPELAECEPIVSNQGSLFRLTEVEFDIIRVLIDEANPPAPPPPKPYTKQMAMDGLFMPGQQFEDMLGALRERKNLVLQGAPGVGKTFVAKRLAYALIGLESPQQVEMIQFHQSYAYEDFIQGFRPTPKGNFDLKPGVFYQFCRRAQRDEAQRKPYVFIIDEINRGNLSKIFGELMLLIEADKRGKHYAIPLAYASDADDRFYIPDNLYFIGTMNTADRSLALVDYALRRRFRFITLRPEYKAKAFTAWLDATGVAPGLVQKIVERMDALNEAITKDTKNLGAGYQIGHSYFCPTGHGQPDEDWYRRVVESEIIPMIEEYWFDDDDRVKKLRSMLLA
jgi:5-methylcytosine-specific restriction protein B